MKAKQEQCCSCGQELVEWHNERDRIWCASLADLVAYRLGKATQHEVYNLTGKRLWNGNCRFEAAVPLPVPVQDTSNYDSPC